MDAALVNSTLVRPGQRDWSLRAIAAEHGTPEYSLRALLAQRDRTIVKSWAVCLLTFSPVTPRLTMPMDWFDRMFFEPEGVAAFFRTMSGGRLLVEWQVFGPLPLMTFQQKQQSAKAGTEDADYTRLAKAQGVPLDQFDHVMWMPDDGVSTAGTAAGQNNRFVGAQDVAPQLACHEMTHTFGVCSHADRYTLDDYADPFCMMGRPGVARTWESPTLAWPGRFQHGMVGPGLIAPYLFVAGWLDYGRNVTHFQVADLADAVGLSYPLSCNAGAPPIGDGRRIAITVGELPRRPMDNAQIWVEYRRPEGFDRGIAAPPGGAADLPASGGLVVHRVGFGSARCQNALRAAVTSWHPAVVGQTIPLPGYGQTLQVTSVDDARREVIVTVR